MNNIKHIYRLAVIMIALLGSFVSPVRCMDGNEDHARVGKPLNFLDLICHVSATDTDVETIRGVMTRLYEQYDREERKRSLVERNQSLGDDVDAENTHGWTALYSAAKSGDCAKVVRLLVRKADIEKGESIDGRTPLHIAAEKGRCDVVRLLLANNANANACARHYQETPLHKAAMNASGVEIIDLLVEAGADVNALNCAGKLPLDLALETQRLRVMFGFKGDDDTHSLVVEALRRHGKEK